MSTYRWLTVIAAIAITVLEARFITGANVFAAPPARPSAATVRDQSALTQSSGRKTGANLAAGSNAVAPSDTDVSSGRELYTAYCAACHQPNGAGTAGVFPSLKGSAVVNRADATKHIDIVLGGLQGARVSGVTYTNAMPPFAAVLSDAAIAAVVDYERRAWGNDGVLIGKAQVTSERARLQQHP